VVYREVFLPRAWVWWESGSALKVWAGYCGGLQDEGVQGPKYGGGV